MEQVEEIEILVVEDSPLDAELIIGGLETDALAHRITWV